MTSPHYLTRRGAVALGVGLAALAARPAFAEDLEERGYALGDVVLGQADAPVTIVEYLSLTCPHCAHFHEESYPEIKAKYIDTGKAKMIVREIYFDQFGLWSSMTARCGGEMGYYRLIDSFLSRQQTWYLDHVRAFNETKNPQPIIGEMKKIGRLAGLSNERMDACLGDQDFLERLVKDFQTTSGEDEVRSTPTFFVNGERVEGAISAEAMAAEIDKHL
ncbi:DsbA family protein [Pikeienuella piscinae]|uniref:DsbA family protein n=1 Tax=Pikeienuella piscinae TaxID=2748098 RepID=A0A7L5C0J1_9RHOB|nr:DsbA family protein [Pikeienuella piscinae]QIE56267.1 DsbA family protein [Pikeienuella piscinae]